MGTTKSRKSRRNNSRPAAFTFLSNISLGNEINSTDINNNNNTQPALVSPASFESQHHEGFHSEHYSISNTQRSQQPQQSMRTAEGYY